MRFAYRNPSALLDPPWCALGESRGALRMILADKKGRAAFRFTTHAASLEMPIGPLRVTVVPGGEAQSLAGTCRDVRVLVGSVRVQEEGAKFTCG